MYDDNELNMDKLNQQLNEFMSLKLFIRIIKRIIG